jgi:hypothetical protein
MSTTEQGMAHRRSLIFIVRCVCFELSTRESCSVTCMVFRLSLRFILRNRLGRTVVAETFGYQHRSGTSITVRRA